MGFAEKLTAWQRRHGRHDLPWQGTRDPYRIWLSEVMLQQTQVSTVIPYYERFLARFPDVQALARASEDQVLALWSGLGYYARGRNLHRAARLVAKQGYPRTAGGIAQLPGVGRSTAAAVAVFAFGERAAILDGNAKRVLARTFGVEREAELWALAERELPTRDVGRYTQALMDLGATVCTRVKPQCERCPVKRLCVARRDDRVAELPARRKRGALPRKEVKWLVLRRNGAVLLERRPAPGIWGGLWCFPELKGSAPAGKRLAPIEHGFTHFRLRIRPLLVKSGSARYANRALTPISWMTFDEAQAAALPAPVRSLLARLREEGH
ncbi:MAG: A/G-specific adenine glycosylase [Burkholderiales bacterium]